MTYKILWQQSVPEYTTYTLYTVPAWYNAKCSLLKLMSSAGELKWREYSVYTVKVWNTPDADSLFHRWVLWDYHERIEFWWVQLDAWDSIVVITTSWIVSFQLYGEEMNKTAETQYLAWLNSQIALNNYILAWNIIANVTCNCA